MESFRRRLGAGYGEPVSLGCSSRSSGNEWFTEVRPKREPMDEPSTLGPSGSPGVLSSRNWTIDNLQKRGKRFKAVRRISALLPEPTLLRILEEHETSGVPLIVENWHSHPRWPSNLFNLDWLLKHCGDHKWQVRDVRSCTDKDVTLGEFIQWSRARVSAGVPDSDQLLYGKDAPCPPEWREWVNSGDLLPSVLCPHGANDLLQNLTKTEEVESLMCYLGIGDTFTPCHKDLCASSGQNIMCYTEDGGSSFWFMTSSSDAPSAAEYFQKHIGQELDWEAHTVTVEEFANAPFTVYIAEQKLGDLVLVPPRSCHQVVNHGGLTVKTSWSRMTMEGLAIALHHELPIYRRVCRPEQYRVKHIIYRSLLRCTSQIRLFHSHVQHGFNSPPPRDRIPSLDVYLRAQGACTSQIPSDGSHTDIPSRRRGQLSRMASDLRLLIGLFDSILHEEYSPAHKDLPTIFASTSTLSKLDPDELPVIFASRTPSKRQPKLSLKAHSSPNHGADRQHQSSAAHNFACDFCGADIFQSFFECRQCRPMHDTGDIIEVDEEGPWQYGDGLLICCHCYAEGRTCLCQTSMYSVQCRPFGDLLRDRNEAVTVLEALADIQLGSQSRHTLLSEHQLSGYSHLNVFAAGCRLSSLRDQASTTTRKCRCGHSGPQFEVIYCNACHTSKCFKDLLRVGLHSAEVILRGLGGGSAFHDLHRETRVDFRGSITRLQSAERSGEVIGHKDRLVFVAQRYSACRPMNPNNVHRGWYDEQPSVDAHTTDPQAAPPTKVEDRSEVAPTAISLSCTDRNPLASTNYTVTPLHLPKVSHPASKLVAEVVLVSRKRAQVQSRIPSSSLSTPQSMSGSKDHPPEDENSGQVSGLSLAKAMNAAISHEARPTSAHVRRGRIYSSSPENIPAHVADTLDDQERPPPPKKRKLAREIAASNPPAKGASSAAGASSGGVKGTRGRPPGRRSLRSDNSDVIKVDEPALAESSTSASSLSYPPAAPLPFNQNAFVGELFLQLSAAQQAAGLRSYANEAQATRASVAEQIDPVTRKVAELEQAFMKIEDWKRSMVIRCQEQDKDAAKTRQQNVLLTTRVSQLESTVERLEKRSRQQESEIQHLRDANDKAESHAIEFDKKMKEELGDATREVREKYEIVKLLIDLKKSPQAPVPTEAKSMQPTTPVLMSHGTMSTMSMTAQAGVTDGAQGMLQQQSPIRQYHTPYQNRRGGYIPRGRGGRPGFSTYHSPPGTHRYGHHTQGSDRYDHHQDGPPPFTNAYRARGDNDGVHATTSYGGHNEYRSQGHHQEHTPYHSKPQLAERLCDSQKYDDGSGGGGRRHNSRWDQDSKPEYSRAETSRGTPYERESTVSSGQTAQPSPRSRSPSKEPAISLDGSPSRGNSPMRGRSRTRKADSDSSYES